MSNRNEIKELTVLDFLAQKVNQDLAIKEGYAAATLWLCTNYKRKEKCLKIATKMFEDWRKNELETEHLRSLSSVGGSHKNDQ